MDENAEHRPSPDDAGDPATLLTLNRALRLSTHVLTSHPSQLRSQLTGRLPRPSPTSGITSLLEQILAEAPRAWLRPLMPSLQTPDSVLMRTLVGHAAGVGTVAVTADGAWAVSASADLTLRLWDLGSGSLLRCLSDDAEEDLRRTTETQRVGSLAVLPGSTVAISAFNDCLPRVWDLATGELLRRLKGHEGPVRAIAVTPEGRRVLTASADRTLRVWDVESGRSMMVLKGHRDEVRTVTATPDGCSAVSGSDDGTVRVWSLDSGTERLALTGHTNIVTGVAVSPDGSHAVSSCADGKVIVWNLDHGSPVRTLEAPLLGSRAKQHRSWLNSVGVTPDGRWILSGARDGTVKRWDLESGDRHRHLKGHNGIVNEVAVTPDAGQAVSASNDRTLRIWDLTREDRSAQQGHAYHVQDLSLSDDETRALSAGGDGTVRLWDLDQGAQLLVLETPVPDEILRDVPGAKRVRSVALLPGDRALSVPLAGSVRVWDLGRAEERFSFRSEAGLVARLAASPNGRLVATVADKRLTLWDLELFRAVQRKDLGSPGADISCLAFTCNGESLVAVTRNATVMCWNLRRTAGWKRLLGSTRRSARLEQQEQPLIAAAISADGRRGVSGSGRTVNVWDPAAGTSLARLEGHAGKVTAVSISRNGRWVASGSQANEVMLWDLAGRTRIASFFGESRISACRVTSAGRTLVAGEDSGRVHILRVTSGSGRN